MWYPSADLKRGRRWKAVKTRLLLELELHEFMPKKPNFEFELLKCNKAPFSCLYSPLLLSLCPKPLADVEVFSNVSLLVLSWENGSQHSFSRKPQELFLLTTSPTNSHERRERKKGASADMKRPKQLHNTGPSQKLITGFLGVFICLHLHCLGGGGEHWASCCANFYIFSSHLYSVYVGCFRCQMCLDWTDFKRCCKGWRTISLPQFSGFPQPPNHFKPLCTGPKPQLVLLSSSSAGSASSPAFNLQAIIPANIFIQYPV